MEARGAARIRRTGVRASLALVALVAMLALVPAAASAAPSNDNAAGAATLDLFTPTFEDTTTATPNSAEVPECLIGGGTMGKTVWFKVTATGPHLTVNTFGSDFDTVLAIYHTNGSAPSGGNRVGCNDQAAGFNQSRVTLTNAVAGHTYLVQVGGFFNGGDADSGNLRIVAADDPFPNDVRGQAAEVEAGTPITDTDNIGMTENTAFGEDLNCDPDSAFASTAWFHYVAPEEGDATFTTTGSLDTVMQVYQGNSGTPLACNDDAPGQVGPSRVQVHVNAGDYFVQVGGYHGVQGFFNLNAEFTVDLDHDNDSSQRPADCNDERADIHPGANDIPEDGVDQDCVGGDAPDLDHDNDNYNRPQDCDDGNAGIHPGATDVAGNGVDEDCVGGDAVNNDKDGDKSTVPADCNDNNPAIHPGARDTPGDGVDQDCKGGDAHFPSLRLTYHYNFNGNGGVTLLNAKVHRGAKIRVTCRGRGCPRAKTYKSRGKTINLKPHFRGNLRGRAHISIRATLRGYNGRVAQITYDPNKRPTDRLLCIPAGKTRPQKHCG